LQQPSRRTDGRRAGCGRRAGGGIAPSGFAWKIHTTVAGIDEATPYRKYTGILQEILNNYAFNPPSPKAGLWPKADANTMPIYSNLMDTTGGPWPKAEAHKHVLHAQNKAKVPGLWIKTSTL